MTVIAILVDRNTNVIITNMIVTAIPVDRNTSVSITNMTVIAILAGMTVETSIVNVNATFAKNMTTNHVRKGLQNSLELQQRLRIP
ncbi:hypothetical protein CWR48_17290 [Oceanobacillus arenosus]|uniref:Uncharacterized protein n=1 Tax=Oceanobacillus arenosus TaxID=1229153 RepID=A0A3D8PMD0_9BACI|nr:hypothetical protein [Oceanobacillus arenosus]RDW16398.1 hypothetical protein CWR48_17290 [Oceanobacillus arenosus]